jgi:hypothetical protein
MRKKVKAKIIRKVTEIAIAILDKDGFVEDILDQEEIESEDIEVLNIHETLEEL